MGLLGTAIDFVGFLAGGTISAPLIAYRWRQRGSGGLRRVEPFCGCGHHLALHDPKTGECYSWLIVPGKNALGGLDFSSEGKRCPCRQYVGPKPPEMVIAQERGYVPAGIIAMMPSVERRDEDGT